MSGKKIVKKKVCITVYKIKPRKKSTTRNKRNISIKLKKIKMIKGTIQKEDRKIINIHVLSNIVSNYNK